MPKGNGAPSDRNALAEQLYASLETMPDGFLLLDRKLRFVYVNAQAERLLQRARADLLGRNVWEELPETAGTVAVQEYARMRREGTPVAFELDFQRLAARIEVRAFPSALGYTVYFRDVTQAHAASGYMRLLQAAVSQLQDIVLISEVDETGLESQITFVNGTFTRVTGFEASEVVGQTLSSFLRGPKTDLREVERIRNGVLEGRSVHGELVCYLKSGQEACLELQVTPFAQDSGPQTHVVLIARDITERKKVDRLLQESIERFRIVSRATDEVVWDWNLIDDTIWWSKSMRARFGYAPEDLPPGSESWTAHIHAEDLQRVTAGIHAVIESAEERWSDEYRFIRADGSCAQVMDRGFVIRDGAGKAVRMVGSIVDVTAQRELEAQLRQSQRLEAVGQLTGGIAHDFNNLLTVILSNAELLEQRLAGDDRGRMLAEMTRVAAERGAELTSRLLAFSRRQALDSKPADVVALVRGMEPLLRRAIGEHITIGIEAGDGVWDALIDKLQLESALLNLSINARDAMAEGGDLKITVANAVLEADDASAAGDYVMLAVADTGTGMDEATLARAFEPFFTTKEVGKGSGLGLSMVYGFVTQSKGRVAIETAPGRGATVKLFLPRARGQRVHDGVTIAEGAITGRERILMVEDDDLVRAQVGGDLQGLGYRVVTAKSGAEALALLEEGQKFDLLFTDVVMAGGVNGRELAKRAGAIAPDMPVLYTSGHPEAVLSEADWLAPGINLLRKPHRRRDLAAKLREVLSAAKSPG